MRAQAATGQVAQQGANADKDADVATASQQHPSVPPFHDWIHIADVGMDIIFCVTSVQKRQSAGKQSAKQAADEGNRSGKAAGAVERVAALSVQQTAAADRDADGTAGSHQRPSTPPLTDGALLGRTLRKITEEEKVRLYPHSCHSCIWSAFLLNVSR